MVSADQLLHSRRMQGGRLLRGKIVVHLSETSPPTPTTQRDTKDPCYITAGITVLSPLTCASNVGRFRL